MPSQEEKLQEKLTESTVEAGDLSFEDAIRMYKDAKQYVDTGFRTDWDNYFKVYKGKRVYRDYQGIADPVIRESHTIVETLVANIAGGNPKFHFVVTNEEQERDTTVLNGMLDYYMICNQMGLKNQEWVRDMLLYGTGILHVSWREGRPFIENIPLRDFFVDPTATGLVNTTNPARYAGYEYLADKEVLKREKIYDPEKDEMVPRYTNLDDIGFDRENKSGAAGDTSTMDKVFKDQFNGSTLGDAATERQIHVVRIYDLMTGRMVEIGNGKKFIYNKPTWCQREAEERTVEVETMINGEFEMIEVKQKLDQIKPFLPFAVLRDYIDTSQFYASGEMELLIHDAELLNDFEAMDVDNNAYQNTPMYWIDPEFADLAPEIETIPGAVYPIPRNAIGAIERPQMGGDLDAKKDKIMARMRRSTAADEAVQGVAQSSSRTTATEVTTQLQQAQARFSTKIANLESEGYAQLGLVIYKLVQIFVTTETAVRIVGPKGVSFKDYDPWEYNGEYEANVELETTIQRKKMEVGMRENQMFEALNRHAGIFDPVELARFEVQTINPEITDEKFNSMLAPPAEPKDETQDFVNVSYKDLEPWAKIQWQKNVGWEPDPELVGEIQLKMLEQANRGADLMDPATMADGSLLPGMEGVINPEAPAEGGAPGELMPVDAPMELAPAM